MFKSLTAYHLPAAAQPALEQLDEQLGAMAFTPCGATQPLSFGFVPPRGVAHSALAEFVGGNALLKLQLEQRLLPASVVRDRVDELAKKVEQESGRKPGAKRRRELKDEALIDLLPQAFTRQSSIRIWFAPKLQLLVLDTTSTARLDAALTALCKAVPGLAPQPLQTAESPSACMKAWLLDGVAPAGFGIGREAILKSSDVMGATVRYSKHSLDGDDVQKHLQQGKEVRQLALNWKDRLDFVFNESLQLKSIKVDEGVFSDDSGESDPFDADALLMTAELSELLPALFQGLGGRIDSLGASPASTQQASAGSAAKDELYDQAVAVVRENKRASISLVQRYLRIGYNRAAGLLEEMERHGVVSAYGKDGSRSVLKAAA